jgi:hypothetical protein
MHGSYSTSGKRRPGLHLGNVLPFVIEDGLEVDNVGFGLPQVGAAQSWKDVLLMTRQPR